MKLPLITTFCALLAAPAMAATFTISPVTAPNYNAATAKLSDVVTESFESFGEGNVENGFSTAVGTFSSIGGVGSGGTVTNAGFDNDGSKLAIRDGNVYGRRSTTSYLTGNASDDMFLDSNDTFGISWSASLASGAMFDRLVFTIVDAAEFGNTMVIAIGDYMTTIASQGNGRKRLVEIELDEAVYNAEITFSHFKGDNPLTNDGFSIDDVSLNQVPLPASALLLLGGLGGLAAFRRRQS